MSIPSNRPLISKTPPARAFKEPTPKDSFTYGRECPDCAGALQFKWDRMKFRPKRKVWICPACFDAEKAGHPPLTQQEDDESSDE